MIKRYQIPAIEAIWSDAHKFTTWLQIEKLVLRFLVDKQILKHDDWLVLDQQLKFDLKAIEAAEAKLKHDVFAFVNVISSSTDHDAKKWIHYGLTSTDLVDTANAVLIKQTNDYLLTLIEKLLAVLKTTAYKYQKIPQIGRTHGIHAEITSFGIKFALFYDEMERNLVRFQLAREQIEVGKISGAVGTYVHTGVDLQDYVCYELQINSASSSTQVIARDNHAFYFGVLNLFGLTINKIATELRHLARTEVNEINEAFDQEQVGSSAMPHKKNPIGLENVCGLSRLLNGYCVTAMQNVSLWHERDISHSSNERILLIDATSTLAYIIKRLSTIIETMVVNLDFLQNNINLTIDAICSQTVMLKLIENTNFSRQEIYSEIKQMVENSLHKKTTFQNELQKSVLSQYLSPQEIAQVFDHTYHLKYVDRIYDRIFNKHK